MIESTPTIRVTQDRPRGPAIETEALPSGLFRRTFDYMYRDGTRVQFCKGQYLYHRKTGGHYVLSSFGYREATMEFGFNYVSEARAEQYWRPIAELFDGRWIFWDGASELSSPPAITSARRGTSR